MLYIRKWNEQPNHSVSITNVGFTNLNPFIQLKLNLINSFELMKTFIYILGSGVDGGKYECLRLIIN